MIRRLVPPLALGLLGTAVLIWLGVWQLHRLAWKEAVLAEIEASLAAAPVALPAAPDPDRDRYLAVRGAGRTGMPEILVQAGHKIYGAGFRVIVPFETGGRRILLDRGFIPDESRDTARPGEDLVVLGNLQWPNESDSFTPDPDREAMLWFARDVPQMAEVLGTEPLLLVARETDPASAAIRPLPIDTAGIPNDHLQYAITWFLLAVVWAGMSLSLLIRVIKRTD